MLTSQLATEQVLPSTCSFLFIPPIVTHLLKLGINIDIKNKSMQTAADIASRYGRDRIVNLLLDSSTRTISNT